MNYSQNKGMKKNIPWLLIILIVGGVLGIGWIFMSITYNNMEASLMNEYKSQEKKIEAVHDAMWKILQQKAGVTEKYASSFDSIYTHIISDRYKNNDEVLFNWVKESNPEFSSSLYEDLSISIEVQRRQFLQDQEKIIDISREYNNLITQAPSKWFLDGKKELDYEVVSSTKSKNVMNTRIDDDVNLFTTHP